MNAYRLPLHRQEVRLQSKLTTQMKPASPRILIDAYLQFFLPTIIEIIPILLTFVLIDLNILVRMG